MTSPCEARPHPCTIGLQPRTTTDRRAPSRWMQWSRVLPGPPSRRRLRGARHLRLRSGRSRASAWSRSDATGTRPVRGAARTPSIAAPSPRAHHSDLRTAAGRHPRRHGPR